MALVRRVSSGPEAFTQTRFRRQLRIATPTIRLSVCEGAAHWAGLLTRRIFPWYQRVACIGGSIPPLATGSPASRPSLSCSAPTPNAKPRVIEAAMPSPRQVLSQPGAAVISGRLTPTTSPARGAIDATKFGIYHPRFTSRGCSTNSCRFSGLGEFSPLGQQLMRVRGSNP